MSSALCLEIVPTAWTRIRHSVHALILCIAALSLSGCLSRSLSIQHPPQLTKLSADRVELPTTFINGCPYVDLMVNGKGPYRFLVDTGADGLLITPRVAREARVSLSRKQVAQNFGSSGDFEMQRMGWVKRVESSGFSLSGVSVSIAGPKTPHFDQKMGNLYYGGIFGMSPLHDVVLEINFPEHKVSVARVGSTTPSAESGIPYTESRPQVTIATPSAKNATVSTTIDTGSETEFEFTDISSYPLRVGLIKRDGYTLGIGGHWRPLFGQLAGDIRLGTAIWRDPEIRSANANRIGSPALASWKIVIDQKKKMLWLVEANLMVTTTWTGRLEPDGRPSVLGFVSLPEGDGFIVKEVDPGSRAERAGLKVGDRYLWESADSSTPGESDAMDASRFRLHVLRGSEKHEITMAISDPLPVTAEPSADSASNVEFVDEGE